MPASVVFGGSSTSCSAIHAPLRGDSATVVPRTRHLLRVSARARRGSRDRCCCRHLARFGRRPSADSRRWSRRRANEDHSSSTAKRSTRVPQARSRRPSESTGRRSAAPRRTRRRSRVLINQFLKLRTPPAEPRIAVELEPRLDSASRRYEGHRCRRSQRKAYGKLPVRRGKIAEGHVLAHVVRPPARWRRGRVSAELAYRGSPPVPSTTVMPSSTLRSIQLATPSTNQDIRRRSASGAVWPAAMRTVPAWSRTGPANGWCAPDTMPARMLSAAARTGGVTAGP